MHTAWGDESLKNGVYLIGAVVADDGDAEGIRSAMQSLLLPGQRKLHWHKESRGRREQICDALAMLPVAGLVVVRSNTKDAQERNRRKCLQRLCWELSGCDAVILESRGRADDARDLHLIESLRLQRIVSPSLRLLHTPGSNDAALWAADALCGAALLHWFHDGTPLKTIRSGTDVRLCVTD